MRISPELDRRLRAFSEAIDEPTKTKTVERLLNSVGSKITAIQLESPIATYENVIAEGAPVVIFGRPNSGKSYALRKLASDFSDQGISIILLDTANEHQELGKKVSANSALARRFRKGIFRIVPETDPRSRQLSISRLFEHLLFLAAKGRLRDFAVFIDEGNELVEIKELRDFLIESRKFLNKAVIVSADPTPYEKICKPMRPIPRER